MKNIKKFIYIGNRPSILRALLEDERIEIVKVFIPHGEEFFEDRFFNIDIEYFDKESSCYIIDYCKTVDFDVCLSAGCPIILPRSSFPENKIFLNSHPSALPYGKGIHPINECVFSEHQKAGSTLHYLTDELDGGDIISQTVFDVTPDLDVSLLYTFIFELEKAVVMDGINKLFDCNYSYIGFKQSGAGSYYSRKEKDMMGAAADISSDDLVLMVRAYSSKTLGYSLVCNDREYRVFNVSKISNIFVLQWYSQLAPGDVFIANDEFLLVATKDGIVRINSWALD